MKQASCILLLIEPSSIEEYPSIVFLRGLRKIPLLLSKMIGGSP
jgi:hypothetical protein